MVHMQYWLWQLYATRSIIETLPLNSRASAKLGSVLPKPWSESSAISASCFATGPEAGQTWGSCWWEQRAGRKLCALPHLKARIPSGRCSCHSTLARHTSTYHRQSLYFRSNSLCSHTFTKLCQGTARGLQPEQKQYSLCLGTGVFLLFAELYAVRKPHLLQNLYQILSLSSFLMFQLINFTDFIFLLGRRNSFKVNEGQCIFLLQLITCSLACD